MKPATVTYERLCNLWIRLKEDIEIIKEQFLSGHGSHYQFIKLQELTEEYEQIDRLLHEIYKNKRKVVKKAA